MTYIGRYTPLIENPYMWLDASEVTTRNFTLVSSTHISSWNDISGNSRHVTQATDSRRPTLYSCSYYGQVLPFFDNTAGQRLDASFNWPPVFTILIAYVPHDFTLSNQRILSSYNGGTPSEGEWMFNITSAPKWRIYFAGGNADSPTIVKTIDVPYVGCYYANSSQKVNLRIDETNVVAEQTTTTTTATQILTIGADNSGVVANFSFSGWISEIILFDSCLLLPQIQRLERYLVQKWG